MRLPRPSSRGSSGPNLTPMIDVVFLLIIFFLVSSHLAKQEQQTPLNLPVAAVNQQPPESAPRFVINVHADRSLSLRGKPIELQRLHQLIQAEVDAHGIDARLHIRCDQASPYASIEPILQVAAQANLQHITFAVVPLPN